jgi:hypothetical protein
MKITLSRCLGCLVIAGAVALAVSFPDVSARSTAWAQESEPIAYVGHGALFDAQGNQIRPTAAFIARAQQWYRAELLGRIDEQRRSEFARFEQQLTSGLKLEGQAGS